MKRAIVVIVFAAVTAAAGCVHVPRKSDARTNVDIRQEIQLRAAASLDFIEGKTDALAFPGTVSGPAPAPSTAHAAGNDARTEVLLSLRGRYVQIVDLKRRQLACESNRAHAEFRDNPALEPKQRNELQRLIAAENKDRKILHEEDARIEKDRNATVSMVERGYAMERLRRAQPGEWVQLPAKGEDFDACKVSETGQRLGAGCVPEARVILK